MLNLARKTITIAVNKRLRTGRKQLLIRSKKQSTIAFCIVHWNAPDFLLLTVNQLEKLYPDKKIYIIDNGSRPNNLKLLLAGLVRCKNVTLFASLDSPNWAKKLGLDNIFEWQSHTSGLQFLLNYSAQQSDEYAVFLDQDCMLNCKIDDLLSSFNEKVVLIGARDYLNVLYDYGPLKKGTLRRSYNLIHPSLLVLQPQRIVRLYGESAFYDKRTEIASNYKGKALAEPYHGLSFKAYGKMLFLETQMHPQIPFLTSYWHNDKICAWHAWYSSRTIGVHSSSVDGYPVSWLREVRKIEYEFMQQIYTDTVLVNGN